MTKTYKFFCYLSLYLVVFSDIVAWGIALTLFPSFFLTDSLFLDPSASPSAKTLTIGMLIALYPMMQFFGSPIIGEYSDRYGRKKLLTITLMVSLIATLLSILAINLASLSLLFITRVVAGFFAGNIALSQAGIADLAPKEQKGRFFALIGMASSLSWIVGPYLGTSFRSPTTPFWIVTFFFFLSLVILLIFFKDPKDRNKTEKVAIKQIFYEIYLATKIPSIKPLLLLYLMNLIGWFTASLLFANYLIGLFSFTPHEVGRYFATMGTWFLGASLVTSLFLLKKFRARILALLPQAFVFIPLLILGSIRSLELVYFLMPISYVLQAITFPCYTTLFSDFAGSDSQGSVFGLTGSIVSIALLVSPLIAGYLGGFNPLYPLFFGGICLIVNFVFYLWWYLKYGKIASR